VATPASVILPLSPLSLFFFTAALPTQSSTLSLHDALPISLAGVGWLLVGGPGLSGDGGPRRRRAPSHGAGRGRWPGAESPPGGRSEEHTSELQSLTNLVCRLLLEKKKNETHKKRHHILART